MKDAIALSLAPLLASFQAAPGGLPEVPWPGWPAPSQRLEDPPPIVPGIWLAAVASEDVDALLEAVVRAYLVDLDAPPPRAGTPVDPAKPDGLRWTEWSGPVGPEQVVCATTSMIAAEDDVRMARLAGGAVLVVNGEPFLGDPGRVGVEGVPVALREGVNRLWVLQAPAGFELELWKPRDRLVLGHRTADWPDVPASTGMLSIECAVFNASLEPVQSLHFHYGDPVADPVATGFQRSEWQCGGRVPSLAFSWRSGSNLFEPTLPPDCERAFVPIEITDQHEDSKAAVQTWLSGPIGGSDDPFLGGPFTPVGDPTFFARHLVERLGPDAEGRVRRVWLVHATRGTPEENAASLALARFDAALIRFGLRGIPWNMSDMEALENLARLEPPWKPENRVVLLYGNARTNAAWDVLPAADPSSVRSLSSGGTDGSTAGWSWNAREPDGADPYVMRLVDDGAAGTRLALLLRLLGGLPGTR